MTAIPRFIAPRAALALASVLGTACTVVGPDYVRPAFDAPAAYKEAAATPAAQPAIDAQWWRLFGDERLDALMVQLDTLNPSLQAAQARLRQARALALGARAARSPTVVAGGTNDLGLLVNWEIDLWGRIQRNIEANEAAAQASAADLAAVRLSLQAQLAQTYFQLRVQDAEIDQLERAIASHERTLQLTRNQYAVGVVARANVVQAQARWQATQAQAHDARATRAQLEHAVAVLVGRAPAEFAVQAAPLELQAPPIPAGLPAQLLERRPDVAAAERRIAVASAQIGVAKAAAYPSLGVFAGITIRRGPVGGAKLEAPLYAADLPQALDDKASAVYDEAVANYRQTVLGAMREVEDSLAAIDRLEQAGTAQAQAAAAARQAALIADNQYRAGIASYLAVAVVQTAALDNERLELALRGRRLVASVQLVKALGGGWQPEPAAAGTATPR